SGNSPVCTRNCPASPTKSCSTEWLSQERRIRSGRTLTCSIRGTRAHQLRSQRHAVNRMGVLGAFGGLSSESPDRFLPRQCVQLRAGALLRRRCRFLPRELNPSCLGDKFVGQVVIGDQSMIRLSLRKLLKKSRREISCP